MSKIIPYLNFRNECREALEFYHATLGGTLNMMTVREMPEMAAQMPAELGDSILHAELASGDRVIYASDLQQEAPVAGNTVRLCVNCLSEEELQHFFSGLSAGGKVSQPIADMPWGARYAEFTDKYGKYWILNFQLTPQ